MENASIEEIVLGAVMFDRDAQIEFSNRIQSLEVFENEENKIVAAAIQNMLRDDHPIDIMTLATHLKKTGQYKQIGGSKKLATLASKVSSAAHIEIHIRILLEIYLKRSVGQFANRLIQSSISDTDDIFETINSVHDGLDGLMNQVVTGEDRTMADILDEVSLKWEIHNRTGLAGMSTGMPSLDEKTGGLVDSDLVIVAARPGQGKTAFVLSILRNISKAGIPSGIFSLEMSQVQLVQRLISQESDVFSWKIRNNKLEDADRQRLYASKDRVDKWPLQINDDASLTIRRLRAKAMMWKKKYGIRLLVVDFLQLMSGQNKKGQNREGEISEISRGLKILAKELNIPIIALSQLSREVEKRPGKMPQLSDLRESGAIEQDANMVIFLMRPEYYKMTESIDFDGTTFPVENLCIVDIAKFRDGDPTTFPLKFHGPTMKFTDYNQQHNEQRQHENAF